MANLVCLCIYLFFFLLSDEVLIYVENVTGKTFPLMINPSNTVNNLKCKIQDQEVILTYQQRLIFARKELEDQRTLIFYNIDEGATVYLMLRLGGKSSNVFILSLM